LIISAYRDRQTHHLKASDIAIFKASDKYVIGVTGDGLEYLLSNYITLKHVETNVSGLIRLSRGVLVRESSVIGWHRNNNGLDVGRTVVTTVGPYPLARRARIEPIAALVERNKAAPHLTPISEENPNE
jgi:hypothetical protein